jgi:hypothetical protein
MRHCSKADGLLDRAGDRAGALRAYESFTRPNREEYDLEATDETQRLITAVRACGEIEFPLAPESGVLEPPTTFIGREHELGQLEKLV